jgi:hypothetical protein
MWDVRIADARIGQEDEDGGMGEHHHHWVLIDGYTNAYTCCDCGASRGERHAAREARPAHRGFLVSTTRKLHRRRGHAGMHGTA